MSVEKNKRNKKLSRRDYTKQYFNSNFLFEFRYSLYGTIYHMEIFFLPTFNSLWSFYF